MTEPVGFDLSNLRVEFALVNTTETDLKKQLVITAAGEIIYDSGLLLMIITFLKFQQI